ncbi:PD-(D/E)XK nuclease family protein [Wolbachia endosymbiont of Folsomia candida]|uniref:PD-(D/E)XK nuclease family protein n=1 Tax=Wolbachia endosymbiont of Folsomia candida TaxID=169402 RepID=UPI000A62551E|nr:PD-(D/E)XK nuclease family protein [Wolbachia endosymbiont of Folsomia candida]APR98814.1 recombinase RecB [Wolbachia endosymbiont of Folsomia candida]
MGKVFTISLDESFFDVLVNHIFSEYERDKIPELKIILPCKRDVVALLSAFKNRSLAEPVYDDKFLGEVQASTAEYSNVFEEQRQASTTKLPSEIALCKRSNYNIGKCIILPEIVSLENIDEEDLILNLDRIKVINPTKRTLLLIEFILEWNRTNNDNFPIDLAYSLSSLLDKAEMHKITNCEQFNGYSKKIENFINLLVKTWSKTLRDLGVVDILEHKHDYINNMVLSLQKDQHVIFVGVGKDENYKSFIKAIYDLPFGKVILPNINFNIKEGDWKSLDKKHYQYCIKSLLDYLNVDRSDVAHLFDVIPARDAGIHTFFSGSQCHATRMILNDYVFDITADLSEINTKYSGNSEYISDIEVITCDSEEEEAQVIALIIENESYEKVSLFVTNKLLATRIACLSKQHSAVSENYPYITLLLYSIEVLTSNWSSVALLSLLKHSLVAFGYTEEKYNKILSEFEIEILRNFSTSGLESIISIINSHKKLKYKEDILLIINKLEVILSSLLDSVNRPIAGVVGAHLQCINMLSGINFSGLNNEVGNFIHNFLSACESINIKCSLELYSRILTLFLEKDFFSVANDLNKFSLYHNKVVILAGFNEGSYPPSFQSPFLNTLTREKFNLPSVQEEQGYFLYTLYNLFCASKVYITRSVSHRKPIILQRLEMLLKKGEGGLSKQPYRDWLRILNTPECVVPCTQPMPKPPIEVRKEKMQVISCSALEKLIRNPYSFYAQYILSLKQLRDLSFKPSILEFGTMVHNILEKCSHDKKSPVSIAQKAFLDSQFNFSNMWWIRLQRIIQSFVEFVETRSNHAQFEKSFSYPVGVIQECDHAFRDRSQCQSTGMTSKEILLTAKCDRVEYLSGKQVAIIDYKLGSPPSNEEVMSGFFPQLILQALAVEHITKMEVLELAYWKFDYDKIKITSLQNYKEKMQEFQNDLPDFLSTYLSSITPFIASPYLDRFLRFNSYKHLERVGEWL